MKTNILMKQFDTLRNRLEGLGRYLTALALACAVGCGTVAKEAMLQNPRVKKILTVPQPDHTVAQQGHIETIGDEENRITVLYVNGTPYEMGFQHGQLLGPQVLETIADVMKGTEKLLPKEMRDSKLLSESAKRAIIDNLLDRAWQMLAPFTPREDLEEMAGLAAGSGIDVKVIHRMHALPDVSETSCSALVAKDSATRDGHVYQLRILDYGGNFNLQKRPLITVYRPTNANAFANIGWVGFVGVVSGLNAKSVALSEMGYGSPPGETLSGMPMPFLLKNVLRYADTADEGATLIRAAQRTNSYVYFIGDSRGGAVGLITSAQRFVMYHANEREFVEDGKSQLPQFKDVVYAGHYNQKQSEIVSQMRGTIDVTTIQDLARQIAMKSNLHTVIYDLTADKIWVANRKDNIRASDRPYVEFSLHDAWTKYLDVAHISPTPPSTAKR